MTAYYNEHDRYAAQWLRNLIAAGHIAAGHVDERSISEVRADDLRGFTQCHFFAGIGGWSYALRLAGWPDARPVWTGSCPCQPFSLAGQQRAPADDRRHLWPAWFSLIAQCRPAIVFGEQVDAAIGWGWLDLVFADLESTRYACGATVFPACSVGAPHIRQRIYWLADSDAQRWQKQRHSFELDSRQRAPPWHDADGRGAAHELGDAIGSRLSAREPEELSRAQAASQRRATEQSGDSFWADCDWLPCVDGMARPVEPGTLPLADGIPQRVGRLRAFGNAIVPQAAAQFIIAAAGLEP